LFTVKIPICFYVACKVLLDYFIIDIDYNKRVIGRQLYLDSSEDRLILIEKYVFPIGFASLDLQYWFGIIILPNSYKTCTFEGFKVSNCSLIIIHFW